MEVVLKSVPIHKDHDCVAAVLDLHWLAVAIAKVRPYYLCTNSVSHTETMHADVCRHSDNQ